MRIDKHPILNYARGEKIEFIFEGKEMIGYEGETIGAALYANGIKDFHHNHERARGIFCAIGNCSSCLMEVDGISNIRVCVERLKKGMIINRQISQGKFIV